MRPSRHVIQGRDDELIAGLFRIYGAQLTQFLTRVLGSAALAQDVVQDTYERLCRLHFENIRNPRAFLFQVGYRRALMLVRRSRIEAREAQERLSLEDESDSLAGPESHAMLAQSLDHLRTAISELTPKLREVVVMRYLKGMEPAEVIAQLRITATAYEQRITAANRQLKQRLQALGVDPRALR